MSIIEIEESLIILTLPNVEIYVRTYLGIDDYVHFHFQPGPFVNTYIAKETIYHDNRFIISNNIFLIRGF